MEENIEARMMILESTMKMKMPDMMTSTPKHLYNIWALFQVGYKFYRKTKDLSISIYFIAYKVKINQFLMKNTIMYSFLA